MADYSADTGKHTTLVAGVVDTVSFQANGSGLRVRNRGATGDIYFTFDGTTPASGADDTYFCGPGEDVSVSGTFSKPVLKLISSGTPAYSVELY